MPACDEHLLEEENYEISKELLNTIKFPRNLKHLNNRLPKSQYRHQEGEEGSNSSVRIKELKTKNSQPILPLHKNQDKDSIELKREVQKYEAIAEIERRYGEKKSRTGKKKRQIPKTTPSSNNGIPNIYMKYKKEARDIAESLKKKNYMKLKEKYSLRAKEVEAIEKKEKLLLHHRVANGVSHNASYDAKLQDDRNNYHYSMEKGNPYNIVAHSNSRSQDYRELREARGVEGKSIRDSIRREGIKPIRLGNRNAKLPETTKGLDNLLVDDNETRKARILRHAQEIREAVSLNREKASGITSELYQGSEGYVASIPKWWG